MIRLLLCLILFALPARAEMPAGHDDPRFQAAVAAWLDADDEASLPVLAELARDGNVAAQILLGRIDLKRSAPGPWLSTLSDQDRKDLFREPGDKFPRSWLRVAAEASPLAKAFQDSRFRDDHPRILEALIDFGETRAASELAYRMLNNLAVMDLLQIIPGKTDDPRLNDIALIAAFYAPYHGDSVVARQIRDSVQQGTRKVSLRAMMHDLLSQSSLDGPRKAEAIWAIHGLVLAPLSEHEIADEYVDSILALPEASPLARLCQSLCPDVQRSCYRMGHRVIGGLAALDGIGSPLQAVISELRFSDSPRAAETVFREILARASAYRGLIDPGWGPDRWDRCLANTIEERLN